MTIEEAKACAQQFLGKTASEEDIGLAAIGLYLVRSSTRAGVSEPQALRDGIQRYVAFMEAVGGDIRGNLALHLQSLAALDADAEQPTARRGLYDDGRSSHPGKTDPRRSRV